MAPPSLGDDAQWASLLHVLFAAASPFHEYVGHCFLFDMFFYASSLTVQFPTYVSQLVTRSWLQAVADTLVLGFSIFHPIHSSAPSDLLFHFGVAQFGLHTISLSLLFPLHIVSLLLMIPKIHEIHDMILMSIRSGLIPMANILQILLVHGLELAAVIHCSHLPNVLKCYPDPLVSSSKHSGLVFCSHLLIICFHLLGIEVHQELQM